MHAEPSRWRRFGPLPPLRFTALVRAGLAACVLTLGMALHWPGAWGLLRFAAGVASALVFVYTSGWCLGQLARLGVPSMGAVIYTGPGAGIVLSGLAASGMVAWHWTAASGWLVFGLLAAVLTVLVWPVLSAQPRVPAPGATTPGSGAGGNGHGAAEVTMLTLAYGLAGFGYIITATFCR